MAGSSVGDTAQKQLQFNLFFYCWIF